MSQNMKWRKDVIQLFFDKSSKKEAYDLIEKNKPNKLYKYKMVNDYNKEALKNEEMWMSTPDNLNDPYDCALLLNVKNLEYKNDILEKEVYKLFNVDVAKKIENIFLKKRSRQKNKELLCKEIEKILKQRAKIYSVDILTEYDRDIMLHKLSNNMINEVYKNNRTDTKNLINIVSKKIKSEAVRFIQTKLDEYMQRITICSLTTTNNNILMWSHYGHKHEGFCIEYDFEEIKNSLSTKEMLLPVLYSNNFPNLSKINIKEKNDHIPKVALIKAYDWNYENEWRIISRQDKVIKEGGLLITFPKVKAIYLGCKIKPQNKKDLKDIARKKGIAIYKMKMKKDSFELEYEELTEERD